MSEAAHSPAIEQRFQPRDRESFLDAQQRNRRATWRLSALCVLAAVVMGIPLALTVTPLLYAVALIAADIINIFSPVPPAVWARAEEVARFGFVALGWLLQHQPADPRALALGAAVLLLPGMVLSLVLWLGVSVLFRRGGIGGALLGAERSRAQPSRSERVAALRRRPGNGHCCWLAGTPRDAHRRTRRKRRSLRHFT